MRRHRHICDGLRHSELIVVVNRQMRWLKARVLTVQRVFADTKTLVDAALKFAEDLVRNVPASSMAVIKQQAHYAATYGTLNLS